MERKDGYSVLAFFLLLTDAQIARPNVRPSTPTNATIPLDTRYISFTSPSLRSDGSLLEPDQRR